MNTSEYGNISWVYFVIAAYAVVALSLMVFAVNSVRRFRAARQALQDEGFVEPQARSDKGD
ncbi:MAG: hypothetical protein RIR26_858 [Pseudomonadota bacterium]|jgi:heme exporter protein D